MPSLYFCQAIPNVAVTALSATMFKQLGVSNAEITSWIAWLQLPWVFKGAWSPLVDRLGTKRSWTAVLQFFLGAALASLALIIPGPDYLRWSLGLFWLLAFASATHDIAADGFYLLALPPHLQAAFVGVRSTFFRAANIAGQGGLVYLAGWLTEVTGDLRLAWSLVFVPPGVLFLVAGAYHLFALPRPAGDRPAPAADRAAKASWAVVLGEFFRKPGIGVILAYLLLYRLGESQLVGVSRLFLLEDRAAGGLGLTAKEVGRAYGMYGIIALTAGGILGGLAIARFGLRRMLWPMLLSMHLPNLAYVGLAVAQPEGFWMITAAVAFEQLGYGFGFSAYMVYMMLVADGPHRTAHYAVCTSFMALGMMLPMKFSGQIQEAIGYTAFFVWACLATLPSFAVLPFLRVDPAFGRRRAG